MAKQFTVVAGALCLLLLPVFQGAALAEDGKDIFQKRCAGCHTIGGGDGAGPDLKGVGARRPAEWLVRVITEPDKLVAEKDPTQLELVKKFGMAMPNLGVSKGDAEKIVAFLQGGAAPGGKEAAPPAPAPPAPTAAPVVPTRETLASGRALFTGKTRFAKGGAPCVSCHTLRYPGIYGGSLAGDLTNIYGGMGEAGVRGVLSALSFPVMRRIYADRPLTEPESTALVALFQDASARNRAACNPYPLTGLGCFVLFVVAAIVLKRRIR